MADRVWQVYEACKMTQDMKHPELVMALTGLDPEACMVRIQDWLHSGQDLCESEVLDTMYQQANFLADQLDLVISRIKKFEMEMKND